jgi:HK97 family phage prohead protease
MEDSIITMEDALLERAEGQAERTIRLRLASWNEVASNTMEGIRESFERGAFAGIDPSTVTLESMRHGGPIVGVAEEIIESDNDVQALFRISATPAGDELLTLVKDKVLRAASVVFRPIKTAMNNGVYVRQAVDLRRVAILEKGAYQSAQVLSVREDAGESNEMETVDLTPVTSRLDGIESRISVIETYASAPAGDSTPELYRASSFGDYLSRSYNGEMDAGLLSRTTADQITSQNAGLIPPAWIADVKGIVMAGRPAIQAFGGPTALPSTGMEIDWPYLNSSNTLVAAQSAENAEVQSARVDIAKGSATIATYSGGSKISRQLIERSSPSYKDAYGRIVLSAWASVTEAVFSAALLAAATVSAVSLRSSFGAAVSLSTSAASDDIIDATSHGFNIGDAVTFLTLTGGTGLAAGRVYWVTADSHGANTFRVAATPGGASLGFSADITAGTVAALTDTTGAKLRSALFEASVKVADYTGAPANVALASTDQFLMMAGMTGLVPAYAGNLSASSGHQFATDLHINVNGLEITHTPTLAAGSLLVSNRMAATWLEDGPKTVTAEDAMNLGQDVAVYSYGTSGIYVPAAIVNVG